MSRAISTILLSAALMLFSIASSIAATMDYLGTWSSSTTYAVGKVVKHNGGIFYSLKSKYSAPNRNKPPSENPAWWEQIGSAIKQRAYFDATGKFIGVLNNGDDEVAISSGGQQILIEISPEGFQPDCRASAAICVPNVANDYAGFKVFASEDCSGTTYYYLGSDLSRGRTYGTSNGSFDWYFPTNQTLKTVSSQYRGPDEGCQRMDYAERFETPSVSVYVNDGTFTKVSISGFTAPFFIK